MRKLILILFLLLLITNIIAAEERRALAEWEPTIGTIISWPLGLPIFLVKELAKDDKLYTLVENENLIATVQDNYESWDINLDNCEFIICTTNSHWTRDWGPVSIFDENDNYTIIDPMFNGYPWVNGDSNRDYELDDQANQIIADYFNFPIEQMPAYFTGGNQMTDGLGTFFSTIQMFNENEDLMSIDEFTRTIEGMLGAKEYHFLTDIENYGIQHIDCGAKLLDEETVIIKQLPSWHQDYERMELLTQQFSELTNCYGRPYRITRVQCDPYYASECAAYTNSLILNKKILVPTYGIESDETALETYRRTMPGYEVIGFYFADWYYYDALHCRTRAIFDPEMLYIQHRPLDRDVYESENYLIEAKIKDYNNSGLINDSLKVFWRIENQEWNSTPLENISENRYTAQIPNPENASGLKIEYYLTCSDNSGRKSTLPRTAPEMLFTFNIIENNASNEINLINDFKIFPNPFEISSQRNNAITIKSNLLQQINSKIEIFNIKGRKLKELNSNGTEEIEWNCLSSNREKVTSGIYFIKISNNKKSKTKKVLLLK